MKSFLKRLALFLSPLGLVALALFLIDPMGMFPGPQFFPVVGRMVRASKTNNYQNSPRDFDTFYLGSSRSLRLDANEASQYGAKAYNFAVFNAMIEDDYVIARLVMDRNRTPVKRIFLGIDPPMFQQDRPVDWRLILYPPLSVYLHPEDRQPPYIYAGRMIQMTARYALRSVRYRLTGGVEKRNTAVVPDNGNLVSTPLPPQILTPERIESVEKEYLPILASFHRLGENRVDYLRELVQECEAKNIELVVFLTPLSSQVDSFLCANSEYGERVEDIRTLLESLKGPHMTWVDFSHPESFGGNETDFSDGAHIGSINSEALLDSLFRLDESLPVKQ